MTIQEYLALAPEEQSKIAGKLRPKPWKHEYSQTGSEIIEEHGWIFYSHCCCKCGLSLKVDVFPNYSDGWYTQAGPIDTPCSVPGPIPIDWNHAKALQGECYEMKFWDSLHSVHIATGNEKAFSWWAIAASGADPIHYFAALLLMAGYLKEN